MRTAKNAALLLALTGALASCGGGGRHTARGVPQGAFATGPVYEACLRAGRQDATRARCGCVQAAANGVLSSSDQSRAATFFKDPQKAQDTRQSDNPLQEAFWKRYKTFAERAEQSCA